LAAGRQVGDEHRWVKFAVPDLAASSMMDIAPDVLAIDAGMKFWVSVLGEVH
jgi:hypothetical protein